MRAVSDNATWEKVVRSFPFVAHWVDAEPIDDVKVMAKLEDRHRRYVVDGEPVATGVLSLADAWACTNPSLGRGMSIGMMHAQALRGMLRDTSLDDARGVAMRWDELTQQTVQPVFDDTSVFDRHRLAQIQTELAGGTYQTDDPAWNLGVALGQSMTKDPELLRGFLSIVTVLDRGVNVLSKPGMAEKAIQLADPTPLPGPNREELMSLVGSGARS
jgi:2-polyprenyl-6-methoxyphenol hydroxylase-like FAD-dependent oxidoreductase